ncbi:P-loop containing nucleoside triphosphate hydrolase protein [Xylaria sp. FL0064]|nr:P-loop containing nucleoside triphosphate hydrolase protein [Xylaria sp. FL0064]
MEQLSDFSMAKRDPVLPCHSIPNARNRDFYGRRDLLRMMEEALAPVDENGDPSKEAKSLAICGPGGVGKTQLANEFAHAHTDSYEAIIWIHAEEETTLAGEIGRVAETLGLVLEGTDDASDPVVTRELVKGWLANPVRSYDRTNNSIEDDVFWLLVFDNVSDPDLLSDYLPPIGSNGAILITSRDSRAKTPLYQVKAGIDLPPLTTKEASHLLLKLTWRENELEERRNSEAVAEVLGGLPLALTQMAGVMVRQSLSFADFVKMYREEEEEEEEEEEGAHSTLFQLSLEPSHSHTIASVWALESLEYGAGLLDVMALLDPDGISETLLEEACGHADLEGYPWTMTAYQDARNELLRSSLIMHDRSESKLTVHQLIQNCARAKMQPDRLSKAFSTAVEILWATWPTAELGVRHHVARWKECEPLSPHIIRLKEHYVHAGRTLKSLLTSNLGFASLLNELGWYFLERGYTFEATECYRISQTIVDCIQNLEQETQHITNEERNASLPLLAEIHNNIAGSATELNNAHEALTHFLIYYKMLTEEQKDAVSVSTSRLTSACFNLGMSYTMMSDYQNAIKWLELALEEAKRLVEPTKIKIARSLALINLGLTFWLQGHLEKALDVLEQALSEREELFGANDRQSMITGRVLHCLGNVKNDQGELEASVDFHERALLHFKETVGSNHHRTGNSCFKVAEHYCKTGNLVAAMDLLDQASKFFDRHPCYSPEKGRVLLLKCEILIKQGEVEKAQEYLKDAESLYYSSSGSWKAGKDLTLADFHKFVHVWGR